MLARIGGGIGYIRGLVGLDRDEPCPCSQHRLGFVILKRDRESPRQPRCADGMWLVAHLVANDVDAHGIRLLPLPRFE